MNTLLPKFQTCLVRREQASFHPRYWSVVDKQIVLFLNCAGNQKSIARPIIPDFATKAYPTCLVAAPPSHEPGKQQESAAA
jgi:hypothetical protein